MKKRFWIIIGVLALLILITIFNLTQREEGEPVEVAAAHYSSIVSYVSGDGKIKAASQVNIQAEVMGRIERLYVKEGDMVKKGEILCRLDRKSYEAQLAQALARYQQAKSVFARTETLFNKNLISQEEKEKVETEFRVAKAIFEDAQDRYEKTEIRSPISGKVVKLNVEEGETVIIGTMNNPGTVLMVIADLSKMLAEIELSETDVIDVKIGDPGVIELDALPNKKFTGVVTKVGFVPVSVSQLTTEEKAPSFQITIELKDTSSLLRPGLSCHAEVETYRRDSCLVVPIQAVGRRKIKGEEKDAVFVYDEKEKKAKLVFVKIGKSSETETEILEGLAEGDLVITGPYRVLSRLQDGARVSIKREKNL